MEKSFTKAFNLSRYLLMIFETQGLAEFGEHLRRCAGFVVEQGETSRGIDNRLQVIVSGILGSLLNGQTEQIFRLQVELMDRVIGENDPVQKIDNLVTDLTAFLRRFEQGEGERMFSERVHTFIKTLPLEELQSASVDYLAQSFCYSKSHFSKKYTDETGRRVQDLLVAERMNRAFEILNRKGLKPTVKEVSELVGFSDPHYFSQLFKKKYGFLPSALIGSGGDSSY